MHHQIGVIGSRICPSGIDKQHIDRAGLFHAHFKRFEILHETRARPIQRKGIGKGAKPLGPTGRIGAAAGIPIFGIAWRIGHGHHADQKFQTGHIQIRARPIGPQHGRIDNIERADQAPPGACNDGNPIFVQKIEHASPAHVFAVAEQAYRSHRLRVNTDPN
ncbi:hypothetical protein AQZ49_07220 [Novosphingobium sp. FSW06-99]|nr:hypothetical protein AQZ49_07220 [Novosphingobium sp. FSW06-99]